MGLGQSSCNWLKKCTFGRVPIFSASIETGTNLLSQQARLCSFSPLIITSFPHSSGLWQPWNVLDRISQASFLSTQTGISTKYREVLLPLGKGRRRAGASYPRSTCAGRAHMGAEAGWGQPLMAAHGAGRAQLWEYADDLFRSNSYFSPS